MMTPKLNKTIQVTIAQRYVLPTARGLLLPENLKTLFNLVHSKVYYNIIM